MPPCTIDFTNRFSSQARALPREQRQELDLFFSASGRFLDSPMPTAVWAFVVCGAIISNAGWGGIYASCSSWKARR